MSGVLLDTNALIWFLNGDPLSAASLSAIAAAQRAGRLLLSPVSAWEASLALRKVVHRPSIRDDDASAWFRAALRLDGARLVPIGQRIALEAAKVPLVHDNRDPGDCFLIATARVRRVPIITRDHAMIALSHHRPDYLAAIRC